jgi:hypothetical protein
MQYHRPADDTCNKKRIQREVSGYKAVILGHYLGKATAINATKIAARENRLTGIRLPPLCLARGGLQLLMIYFNLAREFLAALKANSNLP